MTDDLRSQSFQRLPNFLCIGVQKAGTTLLYEILRQHPQIFLPQVKEVHFFDIDENFNKGIEWYQQHFYGSEDYKLVGDVTPAYIFFEHVPERIKQILGPEIKLLIMLRNPVDRAYSHYWMSFRRGYEGLSFEKAIAKEGSRIKDGYLTRHRFSYISRGFYAKQLKTYLSFFPGQNINIVIFEQFTTNMKVHIEELLDFLGCTSAFEFKNNNKIHGGDLTLRQYIRAIRTNRYYSFSDNCLKILKLILSKEKRTDYPPLKRGTRSLLLQLYKDDINELEILLNKDLSFWRDY
jgi:hypothetical protein